MRALRVEEKRPIIVTKTKKAEPKPRRRRKKEIPASAGLSAGDVQGTPPPEDLTTLIRRIEEDGGAVLAPYREPFGGHWLLLAALPIDQVEPTPYQRDLSKLHVGRLTEVIGKTGRFLDPIIVTRQEARRYWTPNGHHRLAAMRALEAKAIPALVVPEQAVAYQILALNTEKAHNLREKALEVIRMYRELARLDDVREEAYALEFEEASFITLGLCYEGRPRFSGGAYHPFLKRVDAFLTAPIRRAMTTREGRAAAVLALDVVVTEKVEALKARGLTSPYLKTLVVARINPLRFRPKDAEPLPFDEAMERMQAAARKFDPAKITTQDLAGAPPGGIEEEG